MPEMAKRTKKIEDEIIAPPVKEKKQSKEVKTKDEDRLQEIDELTSDRKILGKFVGEVNIHGVRVSASDFNLRNEKDFFSLSDMRTFSETMIKFDPSNRMYAFNEACFADVTNKTNRYSPDGFDFNDSVSFAYLTDPTDPKITKLMISGLNSQADVSRRPTRLYHLFCDVPSLEFKKLEKLIKENPENAERFIEIVFAGLDNSNVGRIPVKKVSIIDIEKYIPLGEMDEKNKRAENLLSFMERAKYKKLLDKNAIKVLEFSHTLPDFH